MAPFTIYPHHPLPYQCRLPPADLYMQSKMSLESSIKMPGTHEDLPLSPYHRISIFSMLLKVRVHLWQVMRRVVNCCMSVTELISSKMFFFICVGKNIAMTGKLKKSGVEAQERPGWEFGNGSVGSVNIDKELEDPEMKVVMELDKEELIEPAEKQESSVNNSDEEDDDEDTRLSEWIEWESEEETDDGSEDEDEEEEDNEEHTQDEDWESERVEDEDSEWSDDDEDDSEGSAESLELWESFLNSSDPYNPLSFSSSTGSRTNTINTPQNQQTQCLQNKQVKPTTAAEEHPNYSKANTKEGEKKVCFSDKVTVHPLVAWSFASRAARDGSCWLQMARDRERFRRRVKNIEEVIKPCLTPEHRACVWERLQK